MPLPTTLPPPALLSQVNALEQGEVDLCRAAIERPERMDPLTARTLREAACLAKLHTLSAPEGDLDARELTAPLREEALRLFADCGVGTRAIDRMDFDGLRAITALIRPKTRLTWTRLRAAAQHRLPLDILRREVHQKSLVIALGGGGGSGHIYLGALDFLARRGLRPQLIAGTSIGALYALFRARRPDWNSAESLAILRALSLPRLLGAPSMEAHFGLPGAMRLCLRESIAPFFTPDPNAPPLPLDALSVPVVLAATGIRAGALPRPMEEYARMIRDIDLKHPRSLTRAVPGVIGAFIELFQVSERLEAVYFGLDRGSEEIDAFDAAGFSAALPGALQFDIPPEAVTRHAALRDLVRARGIFRLCDGALVDNVPAKGAFLAIQSGKIGTRNACVLALDCFAPTLTSPFLALQSLVAPQVHRSMAFAHVRHAFKRPPGPLDLIPTDRGLNAILRRGADELMPHAPLLDALMAPLDPVETRD